MAPMPSRRAFLISAGALLASCTVAPAGDSAASGRPNSPYAANASLGIWPDLVAKAPSDVRMAYEYATSAQQTLQYIPCFCGCGSAGHKDNLGCYVQRFMSDGWVILEPHAANCGVCVGVTLDVISMERRGEAVKDIRRMIDDKWSKVGPSTPTKRPA